jgi:hypothetical protein
MQNDLTSDVGEALKKSGQELVQALDQLITRHGVEATQNWQSNENQDGLLHCFAQTGL